MPSLNEILLLAGSDEPAAARLLKSVVMPWAPERLPPLPVPSEAGFFPGYFPGVFRRDNLDSMLTMPEAARIVFDHSGELHMMMYTSGEAAERLLHLDTGSVGIAFGRVSQEVVESDSEAKLIPPRGMVEVKPLNWFAYLMVYTSDKSIAPGFFPRLSGRLPLNRPIFYYAQRASHVGVMMPNENVGDYPTRTIVGLS